MYKVTEDLKTILDPMERNLKLQRIEDFEIESEAESFDIGHKEAQAVIKVKGIRYCISLEEIP